MSCPTGPRHHLSPGSTIYVLDLAFGFCVGFLARQGPNVLVVRGRQGASPATIAPGWLFPPPSNLPPAPAEWREVAKFYVRSGSFWIDLLASLPIFIQASVACSALAPAVFRRATAGSLLFARCRAPVQQNSPPPLHPHLPAFVPRQALWPLVTTTATSLTFYSC